MVPYKIQHETEDIDVHIISVDTRCVDITVNDNLSVQVKVPIGMRQDMIHRYICMNKQRILQEYDRKKKRNHQALPVTLEMEDGHVVYHNGQKLPFLGNMNLELRIRYLSQGMGTDLFVEEEADGKRILTIRTDNENQTFLRYCIIRYYKKCAAKLVWQKAVDFSDRMSLSFNHIQITGQMRKLRPGLAAFSYKNIEIKNQNTLWGSCSRKKNLKFDWKLAMLPLEIIDYIIVHELTHLKKMNHSSVFWAEIEKVMPEYAECRNWLNKHGKEYEIY